MWHAWERRERWSRFCRKARKKYTTWKTKEYMGWGSELILWRLAGGVDWILLAQDRDRWRAVINEMMYLRVLAPRS
jgi:hypothetical protein